MTADVTIIEESNNSVLNARFFDSMSALVGSVIEEISVFARGDRQKDLTATNLLVSLQLTFF